MNLTVYVPKPGSMLSGIEPHSAIVGTPESEWFDTTRREEYAGTLDGWEKRDVTPRPDPFRIVIDYEGAKYGQANMVTFADKAIHAADRHRTRYPTVARLSVQPDSLIEVGTFDGQKVVPNNDGAAALLCAWIGSDDPKELEVTR